MRTGRTLGMVFCAMLLLGAFATAQYRDRGFGRGGVYQLYRSAHADVDEARKMILVAGRGAPDMRQLADDISYVGSELGGAESALAQGGGGTPPPDPVRGRDPYERAVNLLNRAFRKVQDANGRNRNPDSLPHGDNAQKKLEEILPRLQNGPAPTPQYRERGFGGGGDVYQLYRSAHADVDEARKMLLTAGQGAPDMRQLASDVSYVGSELGGAESGLAQGGGATPPPEPVAGRDPYDRAVNLLNRAFRKVQDANGRNRNPDSLAHGDSAQKKLEEVLPQLQSGRRGGY